MKVKDISLAQYVEWLENKQYFSILKWGDGEWAAIFNSKGIWIGSNQPRSIALQKDLRKSLVRSAKFSHPESQIFFAIPRHVREGTGIGKIERYLRVLNLTKISWIRANPFYYASRDGKLFPLIGALRKKKVVVIGPAFLRQLSEKTFSYADFIEIPPKNCYAAKSEILTAIREIHSELREDVVYSFSAGIATEVFIPTLVSEMPENFLIDFGSLWDVFCGRRTRGYTKSASYTEEILNRNLGLTDKQDEQEKSVIQEDYS